MQRHPWRISLLLASLLTAAAGCGQAPPRPTGAPAAAQLQRVDFALASDVLAFAPLFVAEAENYYQESGLDLKVSEVGGSAAVEAVRSGAVAFSANDSGTIGVAVSKGANIEAVETLVSRVTLNLALSNSVVDRLHLSRQLPLAQRLQALKGLRLGLVSPSGAVAIFTRYLIQKAGLVPGRDATTVVIGATPLLIAAMQKGEIDGFMSSPPAPEEAEAQGAGKVIVSSSEGDIPELNDFVYESIVTSKDYAAAHPDVVRAFAQATARGNRLMRDNSARALTDLEKHFSKVNPDLLKQAVADITPAVPPDGRCTEAQWANALRIEQQIGMIKQQLSATEGDLWTNRYLGAGGAR